MLELDLEEVKIARYAVQGHLKTLQEKSIQIWALEDLLTKINIYLDKLEEE